MSKPETVPEVSLEVNPKVSPEFAFLQQRHKEAQNSFRFRLGTAAVWAGAVATEIITRVIKAERGNIPEFSTSTVVEGVIAAGGVSAVIAYGLGAIRAGGRANLYEAAMVQDHPLEYMQSQGVTPPAAPHHPDGRHRRN